MNLARQGVTREEFPEPSDLPRFYQAHYASEVKGEKIFEGEVIPSLGPRKIVGGEVKAELPAYEIFQIFGGDVRLGCECCKIFGGEVIPGFRVREILYSAEECQIRVQSIKSLVSGGPIPGRTVASHPGTQSSMGVAEHRLRDLLAITWEGAKTDGPAGFHQLRQISPVRGSPNVGVGYYHVLQLLRIRETT
jgi:hypothetical protein